MTKHSKKTTLPIGTISSGTLRLEDLIPALASELDALRLTRSERKTVREALAIDFDTIEDSDQIDDDPSYLYDELTQIADNHCPDYAYFGSTDGDGAEIGVWPSMSSLEDARHANEVSWATKDEDARDLAIPRHSHAVEVTDHGNVTLYRRSGRRWIEVWSVV